MKILNYTLLHALLWTVVVTVLCLLPGKDMPEVNIVNFDKIGHFSVMGLLNFLFIRHYYHQNHIRKIKLQPLIGITLLTIAYGGLMEVLQEVLQSDRTADIYDFAANSLGCLAALLFVKLFPVFALPYSKN